MKKKNGFLTLVFSCYPGGGHMYLGFMKQGLQLMLLSSAVFAMATISYIFRFTGFLIPIFIAYSIFDAAHKRNNMIEPDDRDLELFKWLNVSKFKGVSQVNHYKIIAYVLIVMGAYILLENIAIDMVSRVVASVFSLGVHYVKRIIMSSLLGVVFIVGGFKLLGQINKINSDQEEE